MGSKKGVKIIIIMSSIYFKERLVPFLAACRTMWKGSKKERPIVRLCPPATGFRRKL